jgi:hypothetical protein
MSNMKRAANPEQDEDSLFVPTTDLVPLDQYDLRSQHVSVLQEELRIMGETVGEFRNYTKTAFTLASKFPKMKDERRLSLRKKEQEVVEGLLEELLDDVNTMEC